MDIYTFLDRYRIAYERFDHPAVYTWEEAEKLCPDMPGKSVKNLFLRDRDGLRHFLVVVGYEKSVEVILDEAVWGQDLQCHPLVNTATLAIPHEGIKKFLEASGHTYKVLDVPARAE